MLTLTAISSPEFFLGYVLILFLAVKTTPSRRSPGPAAARACELLYRFLPALTLVLVVTAHMMRMTRAAIISLLSLPYIEIGAELGNSLKPCFNLSNT